MSNKKAIMRTTWWFIKGLLELVFYLLLITIAVTVITIVIHLASDILWTTMLILGVIVLLWMLVLEVKDKYKEFKRGEF